VLCFEGRANSSSGSAEVFCDLDQGRGIAGIRHKTSSPRREAPFNRNPRYQRCHGDNATSDCSSQMKTYDSINLPSSIDVSGGNGPSESAADAVRCGISTSNAASDDMDYVMPPSYCGAEPVISDTFQITVSRGEETVEATLMRSSESESFGFSLSNGINESGVFIGAVKETGPAADKLKPYDRILQVGTSTSFFINLLELNDFVLSVELEYIIKAIFCISCMRIF
jgi:PDZ domain